MLCMREYDRELVIEIIQNMLWALDQIRKRFKSIQKAADFVDSDIGLEKLDSICMQLINIGEALKKIDKITHRSLLIHYQEIEWKKVMGMRDIITHHYFDIDAETIHNVCVEHVPRLEMALKAMHENLVSGKN